MTFLRYISTGTPDQPVGICVTCDSDIESSQITSTTGGGTCHTCGDPITPEALDRVVTYLDAEKDKFKGFWVNNWDGSRGGNRG